jgi:hypothetical protein
MFRDFLVMDRRVLGSGVLVCSAVFLWSQPSAPGSNISECGKDSENTIPPCSENSNRQTQTDHSSRSSVAPIRDTLDRLPLQWSNARPNRLPANMETVYSDLLKQAQAAEDQAQLANAVATVAGIPKNSRHYEMANQLQEDWSQELLQGAIDRYQQGEVTAALTLLEAISPTSQQQARAAELRSVWGQQAQVLEQASSSGGRENWQGVMDAIALLEGTPLYHSPPVQERLQEAINRRFQPDTALTQLASESTPSPSPSVLPMPVAASDRAVEPSLNSANLEIGLAQAIAWAQPPAPPVASTPRPTSTRIAASLPDSPSAQSAIASPEIAVPQAVAALPKAFLPRTSLKATRAGSSAAEK